MKNENVKLKTNPIGSVRRNFNFLNVVFIFSFFIFNLKHLKHILIILFLISLAFPTMSVFAQSPDFTVTPVMIDEKAKARDILKKSLTIINTGDKKISLYPFVNNIDANDGEKEFKTVSGSQDLADSLANWIELSRGVIELSPGEEKTVPFIIRVNFNAKVGSYHAQLSFNKGSTRSQAEKNKNSVSVLINLEVLSDIKEKMQLGKFTTDRIFFSGDDVLFNYQLENIGNKTVTPRGEIRIYNRRGEEIAAIDANSKNTPFEPDKTALLASAWSSAKGFGKYKAFLNLDYGENQTASIQDTIFFWVIPWKMLVGVFMASLFGVIMFAFVFHRWFEKRKLAPALATASMNPDSADNLLNQFNREVRRDKNPAEINGRKKISSRIAPPKLPKSFVAEKKTLKSPMTKVKKPVLHRQEKVNQESAKKIRFPFFGKKKVFYEDSATMRARIRKPKRIGLESIQNPVSNLPSSWVANSRYKQKQERIAQNRLPIQVPDHLVINIGHVKKQRTEDLAEQEHVIDLR